MEADRTDKLLDVVVIGGGPAGLSGALLLGRCLRSVLICDAGEPRNKVSHEMHAFLGSDGIAPADFLDQSRAQVLRYTNVEYRRTTVIDVVRSGPLFTVVLEDGTRETTRSVLVATGLHDFLPEIAGVERFYGGSLHQCPYCDGWENRGKKIGILGADSYAVDLALELLIWSNDVTLFLNGESLPSQLDRERLDRLGVTRVPARVIALEGLRRLEKVLTEPGACYDCEAMFFSPHQAQHSALAQRMGFRLDVDSGGLITGPDGEGGIQGLYAAGNASNGVQLAIVAAAEGIKAARALNNWLLELDQM